MSTFEICTLFYYVMYFGILICTIYFIAKSPTDAVKIGRQLNSEQQKDNAKRNLFLTLFALRGSPVHYDFVRGLNQIDIVFEDNPEVLNTWHIYYNSLNVKNQVDEDKVWELQRTNLLSEMAVCLGYEKIKQTEMQQHYTPVGHNNQQKQEKDMWDSQLTFYKANAAMCERVMERMDLQDREGENAVPNP